MSAGLSAVSPKTRGRKPVIQLGDDSVRVVVPLRRDRARLVFGVTFLAIGGVIVLRVLVVVGLLIASGALPVTFLLALLVGFVLNLYGPVLMVLGAYRLWGAHVVTVSDVHAVMRVELWGYGYRHSRLYIGPGTEVEVVGEPNSRAHIRVDGFRTGAGLRPANFAFGYRSLTVGEADQIAQRMREAISSTQAAASKKRVGRTA